MDKKMENDKKRYSEISKCPLWESEIKHFREDLGGVDIWYHRWPKCTNPDCSYVTEKIPEDPETGPYH